MSEVTVVVELRIEPGRVDDLKVASQAFVARTQTESGTLRYDWHINDDANRCVNLEVFEDSAAFLVHHFHIADLLPMLEGVATFDRLDIIGQISDELRAEMKDAASGFFSLSNGIERR